MNDKRNNTPGPKRMFYFNGRQQNPSNQPSYKHNGKNGKKTSNWRQFPKSSNSWYQDNKKYSNLNNNEPMYQNSMHPDCICSRPPIAYECDRCHQYFHGRLSKICPMHKNYIFLMDFQCCPYCAAPHDMIANAKLTWEQIRKFEEAELPGGDEGL